MAKELRVIAPIVPAGDFEVANAKDIKAGDNRLDVALAEAAAEVAKKANKTDVNNELNKKASTEYVNAELSKKADKTDVAAELVTKANKIDTETALAGKASTESLASTNEAVADLSTEQVTLSARMDEFTKLGEGSTTGDAELADGRVGADGKTYPNIGGAIRGQVADLKSEVNDTVESIRNVARSVYNFDKGLRLSADNTFYKGYKWPAEGDAVPDAKFGRFGRMDGYPKTPALMLTDARYTMTIGGYANTSGIINIGERTTVYPDTVFAIDKSWPQVGIDFYRADGKDVTDEDGVNFKAALRVCDVYSSELAFNKNLIGLVPNTLYPIDAPAGSVLTVSTAEANENLSIKLHFLDENKTETDYWTLSEKFTSRTFILNATNKDNKYVWFDKLPKTPLMLEFGRNASPYQPYIPNNKYIAETKEPVKVKVCAYNVGNWSHGDSPDPDGNDTMLAQLKDMFKTVSADVYLFSEWESRWDMNGHTTQSVVGGLKPYWSSFEYPVAGNYISQKIATNFKPVYENRVFFGDDESRHYVDVVHELGGRLVHFISTHLPWSSKALRDRDIDKLIEYINTNHIEYFVIGGDFNNGLSVKDPSTHPTNAAEMYALVDSDNRKWTDHGYMSCQGSFFGDATKHNLIHTGGRPDEIYEVRPYDNIVCSPNIHIVNAYTVSCEASDHSPIIAELVIE